MQLPVNIDWGLAQTKWASILNPLLSSSGASQVASKAVIVGAGYSITANNETVVPFNQIVFDLSNNLSGLGSAGFVFNITQSGIYQVIASILMSNVTTAITAQTYLNLQKNQSVDTLMGGTVWETNGITAMNVLINGSTLVNCNVGDNLCVSINIDSPGTILARSQVSFLLT